MKKSFRSKVKQEKNYVDFSKMVSRCLDAHTELFAHAIQSEIIDHLTDVDKEVAAVWFEEYW